MEHCTSTGERTLYQYQARKGAEHSGVEARNDGAVRD
jgi:hypothetical protein